MLTARRTPVRCTRFDFSKTTNDIIPRNYGNGPGSVSVNLRVSRTFSFGGEANRSAANANAQQGNQAGGQGRVPIRLAAKRGAGGAGGRNNTMIGGGMVAREAVGVVARGRRRRRWPANDDDGRPGGPAVRLKSTI